MGGVLYQKAKEYEDYAWQLHDELVEKLKTSRNAEHAMSETMEKIHRVQEIESTVEEIINNDLYEMIDTIKEQRAVYHLRSIWSRIGGLGFMKKREYFMWELTTVIT